MSDARRALALAGQRLAEAGVPDPGRDARRLLAHVLGIAAERLSVEMPADLGDRAAAFDAAVTRRVAREPLSHITGSRLFWGRSFAVTADVLDPRPETEALVAHALEAPFARVLDLGTGSGCLLLTLLAERPQARGQGVDLSPAALAVAGRNRAALGLEDRAELTVSDWFGAVSGRFDLIVSNPPYITEAEMAGLSPEVLREPAMALSPGGDGLDSYRVIAAQAGAHLLPGGRLAVEIGWRQGAAVAALFAAAGLEQVAIHPDMDGRDRVVAARAPRGAGKDAKSA
ncbi:peptide chain release factor N(5)-glutamine methyltransferase [Oceanicola sp. S124]|uniref:peptide chain release factor N(5)-glutamine methyltransferase n=1 Tax=Oceanicola sp. S124 TaxID=1042378 RepID=UPI0002558D1D|nr:peptide chain release factor N(5)-glutamine methyltransferase [Oceanicola sp. S124]